MSGNSKRRLPVAVAVPAIAAMAVAARSDGPVQPGPGDGVWDAARPAAAVAALALLIVIAANFAKHRDDGYGLLRRAGTATAVLLTAAAVLTPVGLLFLGRKPTPPPAPTEEPEQSSLTKTPPSISQVRHVVSQSRNHVESWIVEGVLYLLAIGALALFVYVLVRLLAWRRFIRTPLQQIEFDPLALELDELTEAVAAGAEALEYEGDAREAVIACYSAMEQTVSAGGAGRRITDTPEEFLRRVTASGIIPERPARRLTELFREARFSRHPIAEGQRDEAREALREISEHVRIRAEELAAATERAKAQAGASAPTAGRAR